MAGITELLGETLSGPDGSVNTSAALDGKTIALYFSAHWCPPCRGFTPQFAEWYTKDLKGKGLEVVFCSSDRDEASFNEYFGEMPWLALPFSDRERKEALSKQFKVSGIPAVVIIDCDGNVLNKDGRSAVSGDPTGEDMPWKTKTLPELLEGMQVVGEGGVTQSFSTATEGKVTAFYFSAHWCPPCRGFTPQFAEWYTKDLKGKGLEVVFCSSDKDETQFDEYFGEMPWLAMPYADRKLKEQLSEYFGVNGIPSVAIIDSDGSVITKDGRASISGDPTGSEFPWHPKPVFNLKGGPGNINEVTTVIALCETNDTATQKAVEEAMNPIAIRYIEEAKAAGEEDPKIVFAIATEAGGIAGRLRQMFKLSGLPPSKHEHPLEKVDSSGGWGCDGCGESGEGKDRFKCSTGCNFDYCGDCHSKAGGDAEAMPVKLMICDIPDNGGYYEGPESLNVTTADVEKLISDYTSKALTRQQLGSN